MHRQNDEFQHFMSVKMSDNQSRMPLLVVFLKIWNAFEHLIKSPRSFDNHKFHYSKQRPLDPLPVYHDYQ